MTAIAGLLGVMANRLARPDLTSLERRRHLAGGAINFCTGAALLVCTVLVTLFIEAFSGADLRWLAGAQFIAARLSVIAGLSCFLAEVYIAAHASRIDVLAFEGQCSARHGQGAPAARASADATSAVLRAAASNARVRCAPAFGACTDHPFHAQSRH